MRVYGLRIYQCLDFYYLFRPLAFVWRDHIFVNEFGVSYDLNGNLEDPVPELRDQFGSSLAAVDLESQLMLLRGDDFGDWGPSMNFREGAILPIFREGPPFDLLKRLFWSQNSRLTSDTWPSAMRALLHMWDDTYWQLFTTERGDVDVLIRAHAGNPKLKLYSVVLDNEYPLPSNQTLQPAAFSVET